MYVAALWRYPVKSMQGEAVARSPVDAGGLLGDRAYAVVDLATGRVASAKHPRRWAALLRCHATYAAPPRPGHPLPLLRLRLPDGRLVTRAAERDASADSVDSALSDLLGRAVRLASASEIATAAGDGWPGDGVRREADRRLPADLGEDDLRGPASSALQDAASSTAPAADATTAGRTARPQRPPPVGRETGALPPSGVQIERLALAAPSGCLFDVAPLHVLTDATLARLVARHPAGDVDVRRFRPNLLLAGTGDEYSADGRCVGSRARFRAGSRVSGRTSGRAADDDPAFVENSWIGRTLVVRAEPHPLDLRVLDPTPRCVVTALAQAELPADLQILRTVAGANTATSATLAPGVPFPGVVGVYATCDGTGMLETGARVRLREALDSASQGG